MMQMRHLLATISGVVMAAATVDPARAAVDPLLPTGLWQQASFGSAPLPPMGWNSWNAFATRVDEQKLMGSAKAIVASGLRELGYRYVNIDDGWWLKRRQPDGRMVIRTDTFPSARQRGGQTSFRPIVEALHAMQLKAGIYTDIGRNACSQAYPDADSVLPSGSMAEREVGSFEHVDQDMSLYFKEWGFDYIKVDGCGLNAFAEGTAAANGGQFRIFPAMVVSDSVNQTDVAGIRDLYGTLRDALKRIRPQGDFVLSICNWGTANVRAWGRDLGNLWRTSDDIEPRWTSMLFNFDSVATRELYSAPGHWNDPDMLYVGHGDFDENHLTEARTHFALWAIEDAPLIIGYDLRQPPKALLDIWSAAEIIAVNQDPGGNQGTLAYTSDDAQIIVKQLEVREEKAVVIFNRGTAPIKATLTAEQLKYSQSAPIHVRDLWARRDLEAFTGETSFDLAARASVMLRVRGQPVVADGLYLSEMPARIYVAADGIRNLQPDPQLHRPTSMADGTRGSGTRSVLAGWGAPRADSTPFNNVLRLRGRSFTSGIGALANSRLQVRADAQFRRLAAQVGIDDSSPERSTRVQFEVYGDGRLLAKSGIVSAVDAPWPLDTDVSGVKVIELIAHQMGDGHGPTVITWAQAALQR